MKRIIYKIRGMYDDAPILMGTILVVPILASFFTVDSIFSKPESTYGNIVDKQYEAERTELHPITINGTTTNQMPHSYPEKFLVMVKTRNGEIETVEAEPELYYELDVGDNIEFNRFIGPFSGIVWRRKAVK